MLIFDEFFLFGAQSMSGKILTFHGMSSFGMLRSRIPVSEIYWKVPDSDIEPHEKVLWDCNGYEFMCIEYDYLSEKRCEVLLKNGSKVWATYLSTFDWYENAYSEIPEFYKCAHLLMADDGYFLLQPNNRIFWKDMNWITKDFPVNPSELKVDQELISVESFSDRWITEDNNNFYYQIKKV